MFITIKHPTHEEQIPVSSVLKFAKNYEPVKYEITLSELGTNRNQLWNIGVIKNIILEISQELQPLAFAQIEEYLSTNTKN